MQKLDEIGWWHRPIGWDGETGNPEVDISNAQQYLDENIGTEVEDPGYF